VISKTNVEFWAFFGKLPVNLQELAREKFRLWQEDAFSPGLQFKPLFKDLWSVRINQQYRAVGRRRENLIIWFWIGSHSEYDQLLNRL